MESIKILGIPVHNLSYDNVLEHIAELIKKGGVHQIVTINPEFLVIARKNKKFRQVLINADLALIDGVGLQYAAILNGNRFVDRIGGTQLVEKLIPLAEKKGWKIFFLGAMPGVAQKAADDFKNKFSKIQIMASSDDPTPEGTKNAIEKIKKFKPHLLFVAYGAPKQDLWIYNNKDKLNVPVMIGVGGAFDYLSGKVKRPPKLVSQLGFEWLWRLINQPWRWKRQLTWPYFVLLVIKERFFKN